MNSRYSGWILVGYADRGGTRGSFGQSYDWSRPELGVVHWRQRHVYCGLQHQSIVLAACNRLRFPWRACGREI